MGQTISRRLAGKFEKGLQRARKEMDQQMRDDVKKDKYGFSDPNAVMGFTRGMDGLDPRDAKQEEYQNKDGPMDMPPVRLYWINGFFSVFSSTHFLILILSLSSRNTGFDQVLKRCWTTRTQGRQGIYFTSTPRIFAST